MGNLTLRNLECCTLTRYIKRKQLRTQCRLCAIAISGITCPEKHHLYLPLLNQCPFTSGLAYHSPPYFRLRRPQGQQALLMVHVRCATRLLQLSPCLFPILALLEGRWAVFMNMGCDALSNFLLKAWPMHQQHTTDFDNFKIDLVMTKLNS
ncbi:hypothetical protein BV22DRAFT_276912 [Leucogyrophana mollusca]|uniref:Uncharacterized protein n=1 Tax=Leucogyrophana mollusca TaxID=85980 RepID=A0ACB8BP94_9AGAM|nr:hypothetical protein BV22DRAFT_276912 [Leucogyrophana mollusca]